MKSDTCKESQRLPVISQSIANRGCRKRVSAVTLGRWILRAVFHASREALEAESVV